MIDSVFWDACVKVYKKNLLESMLKIKISKFGLREKLGQHLQKILRRVKWWRYWDLRSMFRIRNDMANKGYCRTKIETWKFKKEKGKTPFSNRMVLVSKPKSMSWLRNGPYFASKMRNFQLQIMGHLNSYCRPQWGKKVWVQLVSVYNLKLTFQAA